ncbi:MAG TPA: hypothetical protein ENI46_00685 [Firmicutes bacterium]|nr:hypothetical protein [Bacillota bacterium]
MRANVIGLVAVVALVSCCFARDATGWYQLLWTEVDFGNGAFTLGDYALYNGAFLDEQTKRDLTSSVPSDGLSFFAHASTRASYEIGGKFSVGGRLRVGQYASLPKDVLDLILFGNEMERTYSLEDARGEASALAELSFGYRHRLSSVGGVTLGGSFKVIKGFGYGVISQAEGTLFSGEEGISGDGVLSVLSSRRGSGYGLDVWAEKIYSNMRMRLYIEDLYTVVTWRDCDEEINRILVDLDAGEVPSDSLVETVHEVRKVTVFEQRLKPRVELTLARAWDNWLVGVAYSQSLGWSAFGSGRPHLEVSCMRDLTGWLSLEAELGWDGEAGPTQALGIWIGKITPFVLRLTSSPAPLPSSMKSFSVAIGLLRQM